MQPRRNVLAMFRSAHAFQSMFAIRRDGDGAAAPGPTPGRRLEAWRAAASLVWTCWEALLAAPPEHRARAFAAYTTALDAEAAAAADMAAGIEGRAQGVM